MSNAIMQIGNSGGVPNRCVYWMCTEWSTEAAQFCCKTAPEMRLLGRSLIDFADKPYMQYTFVIYENTWKLLVCIEHYECCEAVTNITS